MRISDVLHAKGRHEVVTIRPTDKVSEAVRSLSQHRIGALIVEDRWMKPVGVFSERDFVNAVARNGASVLDQEVHTLMSAPVISIGSGDRIDLALARMTSGRIRHLPVIEGGRLIGIVSIGDLVKHRLDEKELEADVLLELTRLRV